MASLESEWSFLLPWRDALRGVFRVVAHRSYPFDDLLVAANFCCWPQTYQARPRRLQHCVCMVTFPGDDARRQDRAQAQWIREAVEIFDTLSAVSSEAFIGLLSEFGHLELERKNTMCPTWECTLSQALSPKDVVATKADVTWAALFGCPEDPMEYSLGFREAMQRLQSIGLGLNGEVHNEYAGNCWKVELQSFRLYGRQEVAHREQIPRVSTPFSRELGRLLDLTAPPPFHVESVFDPAALVGGWRRTCEFPVVHASVDELTLCMARYSAGSVPHVVAALAETKFNSSFRLVLEEGVGDRGAPEADVNAGFLFSTLFNGHPSCLLNGVERDFPVPDPSVGFKSVVVDFTNAYRMRFGALFSAFAQASSIVKLEVVSDDYQVNYPDPAFWNWMAYAFWSREARSAIETVSISLLNLTAVHVSVIEAAMQCGFPVVGAAGELSSHYGHVNLLEGTELQLGGSNVVVRRDLRCRAVYDPESMNEEVNVVVPGYGVCRATLSQGAVEFVCDASTETRTEQNAGCEHGVSSLNVEFSDVDNDDVVPRFLKAIGSPLRILALGFECVPQPVHLELRSFAVACPALSELSLSSCNVAVSLHDDTLRGWGLAKLTLFRTNAIDALETLLGDPSYKLVRTLVQLKFSTSKETTQDVTQFRQYAHRLLAHDGDVLPVVKEKFPLESKLALISTFESRSHIAGKIKPLQRLDANVVHLVFAFAATPESRSVVNLGNLLTL
jgi:hypothetical protein